MRITDGSHRKNIASIVASKISKKATENISNLFVSNNLYSNSCPTPFIYRYVSYPEILRSPTYVRAL